MLLQTQRISSFTSKRFDSTSLSLKMRCPQSIVLWPISLLPAPSKIFERLLANALTAEFRAAVGPEQHGGVQGASTTTASIAIHDQITSLLDLDSVSGVQIVAYDMAKAFDKLDHGIIIKRLTECEFPKEFVQLMISYLSDRQQSVRLGSFISPPVAMTSGVPQGSVLGPLLYNAASGGLKKPSVLLH